jgi:hypothetical protein
VDIAVLTPNQSVQRDRELADALERSLAADEATDSADMRPKAAPAPAVRDPKHADGTDSASLAAFR